MEEAETFALILCDNAALKDMPEGLSQQFFCHLACFERLTGETFEGPRGE